MPFGQRLLGSSMHRCFPKLCSLNQSKMQQQQHALWRAGPPASNPLFLCPPDGVARVAPHERQPDRRASRHAAQHGQRVGQRHLSTPQEPAALDHLCGVGGAHLGGLGGQKGPPLSHSAAPCRSTRRDHVPAPAHPPPPTHPTGSESACSAAPRSSLWSAPPGPTAPPPARWRRTRPGTAAARPTWGPGSATARSSAWRETRLRRWGGRGSSVVGRMGKRKAAGREILCGGGRLRRGALKRQAACQAEAHTEPGCPTRSWRRSPCAGVLTSAGGEGLCDVNPGKGVGGLGVAAQALHPTGQEWNMGRRAVSTGAAAPPRPRTLLLAWRLGAAAQV